MLRQNPTKSDKYTELDRNIVFVTTIYDTFEALEETLGKLKLERPLFMVYLAKKTFAEEVFNYAKQNDQIYLSESKSQDNSIVH
ncbi:MAG: hypothetical protein J6X42_03050 [Alphaproteobacteria bacterium]|nr:hypothetical protein [Alphaproteobacteria bacterium]